MQLEFLVYVLRCYATGELLESSNFGSLLVLGKCMIWNFSGNGFYGLDLYFLCCFPSPFKLVE